YKWVWRPGTRPVAAERQHDSTVFHTLPSVRRGPVTRIAVRSILGAADAELHAGKHGVFRQPRDVLGRNKVGVLQAKASVPRPVDLLNFFIGIHYQPRRVGTVGVRHDLVAALV